MMLDPRGQDDYGQVFSEPQLLQYREAINGWKHDIKNYQIISSAGRAGEASAAIVFAVQAMASLSKKFLHHRAQLFVVIDEQERQLHLLFRGLHRYCLRARRPIRILHRALSLAQIKSVVIRLTNLKIEDTQGKYSV